MEIGVLAPPADPRCGLPEHAGWRVWRDGFQGRRPTRRQRYRCVNPDDSSDWHRFAPPVSRSEATGHLCVGCHQSVPANAGPIVARGYRYYARVVADCLVSLARGRTYTDAAAEARVELAEAALALARRTGEPAPAWAYGEAQSPLRHGQLAADWTEVFADLVAPGEGAWPEVLLLDSTDFWRFVGGGRKGRAFSVLVAYGYDLNYGPHPEPDPVGDPFTVGDPLAHKHGRLLRAKAVPQENTEEWRRFLREWPGEPAVVVADGARSIFNAVRDVWPSRDRLGPEQVRCVWHLGENLRSAARNDIARVNSVNTGRDPHATRLDPETHPLVIDAPKAVQASDTLRAYRVTAWELLGHHRAFNDERPSATIRWLQSNETQLLAQLARVGQRPGPQSVGPLEADIAFLRRVMAGRAQSIRNPARTNLLLQLLVAGRTTSARAETWASVIYDHLHQNQRATALAQRHLAGVTF